MWRTKLGQIQVIQRSWLTKNHGLTAKNQPLPLQMPVPKIHCLRNLRIQHKVSAHHWCRTMFLTKADTCITRLTHPTKSIREKTLELSKWFYQGMKKTATEEQNLFIDCLFEAMHSSLAHHHDASNERC